MSPRDIQKMMGNFQKRLEGNRKEVREEEAERLKMQGSQATIELSFGISKRNMPPKGGANPYSLGK